MPFPRRALASCLAVLLLSPPVPGAVPRSAPADDPRPSGPASLADGPAPAVDDGPDLGTSTPGTTRRRLAPRAVQVLEGPADGLPALFDRDTTTSMALSGPRSVVLELEEPAAVSSVAVFGSPDMVLTVSHPGEQGWSPLPGLRELRTASLPGGWSTLSARSPAWSTSVRLDLRPAVPGTVPLLGEIELWTSGPRTPLPADPAALGRIPESSLREPLLAVPAFPAEAAVGPDPVTLTFALPRPPAHLRRAWLAYEARGLTSWTAARRSVNGLPALGGGWDSPSAEWSLQVERINPEWLREGLNEVAFSPSEVSTTYEVRSLRLLAETDDGGNGVETVVSADGAEVDRALHPAVDGDAATRWAPFSAGAPGGSRTAHTLHLDRPTRLTGLAVLLPATPSGSLEVQAVAEDGRIETAGAVRGSDLPPGWSAVPLSSPSAVRRVRIVAEAGGGAPWSVLELAPIGSGVGRRTEAPAIVLVTPIDGRFAGREATLRGFVTPADDGTGPVRVTVGATAVETPDGAFGVVVDKDEAGFAADDDSAPWSVTIEAAYPGGARLARTVRLDRHQPGPESVEGRLLGARSFSVRPELPRKIRHDGAALDLEVGSVDRPKDLTVTPLREEDLPALDTGLTNVTRGPRRGYRFEPHGTRFQKMVRVSLPYDPALLPDGMSEEDVRTFWFDDQAGRWTPLPRVEVDPVSRTVVSLTDHFTDMINGTLSMPEHPELLSHDPTTMEKIEPADPADRIVLVEPPKASHTGEARIAYPLDLPRGRAGLAPSLGLAYASDGGNGWVGLGWSVGASSISVDTRWGVPRYDAGLETETYELDGDQLAPLAHRATPVARQAERAFHKRTETAGSFARIVRHGVSPDTYWWEVTDKQGVTSTYGGDASAVLADAHGNVFRWMVRETRDLHGNAIRYAYARVDDPGVAGGTVPGTQLYLRTVNYTGFGADPGAHTVTFVRDSDLGEPRRPDVTLDARGGFKMVTSQLLRRIEVTFQGAPVRSWDLEYARGAFEKTLLAAVTQRGADGSALATHRFTYFDEARDGEAYLGFAPAENWDAGADGVASAAVDALASLAGDDGGKATALSGYESTRAGGHLYAGFNPGAPTKQGSVGGKVGFGGTLASRGLLSLIDLNGDGLPDKVFETSSGVSVRLNRSGPAGAPEFGPAIRVATLPAISEESTSTVSFGAEAYLGVSVIANEAVSFTRSTTYLSDVNGDGLPDLVRGGTVLFNRLHGAGVPTFDPDSAGSPVPVGPAAVDTGLAPDYGSQRDAILAAAPLHDTLRRWTAPFGGHVRITGDVALEAPPAGPAGDGVRVAVQHNATELWSDTIEAGDTAPRTPSGVDDLAVARGDRIYFRVQSRAEGSSDRVDWDPEISYLGVPASTDANGLDPWRYRASEDFTLAGRTDVSVQVPFTGRIRLDGDVAKTRVTSDDVQLKVYRDGQQVYGDVLDWDDVGTLPTGIAFDVTQGQVLRLRVKVDSPIDLRAIEWTPSLYYLGPPDAPAPTATVDGQASTLDRVVDDDGNPLIQLHPPYDIDSYPADGLTAPQEPWVAGEDGTVTISSHLVALPDTNGTVFMTAKRRGELAAKRTISIVDGVVSNRQVDIGVEEGDEIFLDYSCLDPEVAARVGHRVIEVDGDAAPSAFHVGSSQGVFPRSYRGWAVAGYNGNPPRDAQPIAEADLDVAFDEDSTFDPRTARAFLFTPSPETGTWRGPEDETYVSSTGAGSSRLGPNAPPVPAPGAPGRAPARLSSSSQLAGELGVAFLSGSLSSGDGGSDLDFLDLNGDRFPDVVGRSGVQFSPALGGLEPAARTVPGLGGSRATESEARNVGVGGSPATFRVGAAGQVDSPGRGGAPKENGTGSQMASLGLSGGLGSGSSRAPRDLVDLNGDGLPDRVTASGGSLTVAFNLGYSFASPEPWGAGALMEGSSSSTSVGTNLGFNGGIYDFAGGASVGRSASEVSALLVDVNGDGLADRVRRSGPAVRVGLNTGAGFLPDTDWGSAAPGPVGASRETQVGGGAYFTVGIGPLCLVACYVILNPGADVSTSMSRQESALLDLDGDGDVDHVTSAGDASLSVARGTVGRTNLLRTVARPLGATITLDYERAGNTVDLPPSRWVVSRVALHDGLPGDGVDTQVATLSYGQGIQDRLERTFLGFGRVVEEVRDASQGEAVIRRTIRDYGTGSVHAVGLLLRERLEDGAGRPFQETENAYQFRDPETGTPLPDPRDPAARAFPALVRVDQRFYEGQPAPGKATSVTRDYDLHGNVVREVDTGDSGPQDDTETVAEFPTCPATHLVGAPVGLRVTGNGAELRRRTAAVDCATGNVTRLTEYLESGAGAETLLDYDAFGNLVRTVGPPNHRGQRYELRFEYDPVIRTWPVRTADSFGYVSTTAWDLARGLKTGTTDLNGNTTAFTYDAHGRLTTVTGPYEAGSGAPTVSFAYHPGAPVPWSLTRRDDRLRNPGDPIDTARFIDGLRREVQVKEDATVGGTDVMVVSGRLAFDAAGRIVRRWYPVTEPIGSAGLFNPAYDPQSPALTAFDVLDRVTSETRPDGTLTTTTYGFGPDRGGIPRFESRVTDAEGAVVVRYQDVRELLTGIKRLNRTPQGTQEVWTSYAHDPLERLVAVTDDRGNVTRYGWDNLGRKVLLDSPDAGRTEDAFDLAGNRTARVTGNLRAAGRAITWEYDHRRVVRIRYPDFPGNDVSYTYGTPGAPAHRAGRIVTIADASGTRERSYGRLGEIVSETRTVLSATGAPQVYRTESTYDSFARLRRLVYPDGEALTYLYDSGGRVRAASGEKEGRTYVYLRRLEYDRFGQETLLEAGNGTRTTMAYRPDTRRLLNVSTTRADGSAFVNRTYLHDAVGNVLRIVNDVPVPRPSEFGGPLQLDFGYDDLDRLVRSSGTYRTAPDRTDRYDVAFDYDTLDNLVARRQVHEVVPPSGNALRQHKTSYDWAYEYAGPRPHAATHVGGRTLLYDANGNQLGWDDDRNGTRRRIVWDEENRVRSLSDNGHTLAYVYDDAGQRVIKRGPQGETVYANPWYTERNGTLATKHVWVGSGRLASKLVKRNALEKDQYFYHPDHAGSAAFVTDASGRLYEHLESFPFGETWVRESTNTQRTPYAFTGKELDEETGLLYVDARYHDPRLGSFNSSEPLLFPRPEKGTEDPRFWSVYSYARQNPVRYVDPDGRDVIIVVGEAKRGPDAALLSRGYPAAATALREKLGRQGINAVIVKIGASKEPPLDQIRAAAGQAKGKVTGLVYIGHGDVDGNGFLPRGDEPVSVKAATEAAGVVDGGGVVAYGCKVAVNSDLQKLKNRNIRVLADNTHYTYTTSKGQVALGDEKQATEAYGPLSDLRLREVTDPGRKAKTACMGCPTDPSVLEILTETNNDTK